LNLKELGSGETKLETTISYLLIAGVVLSLALEVAGIVIFYKSHGSLDILLQDKAVFIQGRNFFSFLHQLFAREPMQNAGLFLMTLGVATLILTPFVRVIASALYFAWRKDAKYMFITAFVLIALTLSLALH
jgi:uncharacterized membrane protein